MPFCRRHLPLLVAAWIITQFGTTVAASAILQASRGSVGAIVCQCPGTAPGSMCPMHQAHSKNHDEKGKDDERCALKNALGVSDIALFAWLTGCGVPLGEPQLPVPQRAGAVSSPQAPASDHFEVPDAPPPRL